MNRQPKILLVSPGTTFIPDANFGDTHLVSLGTFVQERCGARVTIVNLDLEKRLGQAGSDILFDPSFSIIGLSCYSSFDYLRTYYLAVEIRKQRPDACIVVGGYHPSARPDDFLAKDSPFDHVVVGEGELPLADIVNAVAAGQRIEQQVLGPDAVSDLDELPPLDWTLMDRYIPYAQRVGLQANFYLSRGCPFQCAFCMEAAKKERAWRAYSPPRAEQELRSFHQHLNLDGRKLFLTDPLFGLNRAWRKEMFERLARLDLPVVRYWALSRVDNLDGDDVETMARLRLSPGFGIESGDPGMLEIIHKGGSGTAYLDSVEWFARAAAKAGLPWGGNIIAGHPGETRETLEASASKVKELFASIPGCTGFLSVDPFRFYPGSGIDANLAHYQEAHGTRIHRPRWWNFSEPDFTATWVDPSSELDFLTREQLTHELFAPIARDVAARFSYSGPDSGYFRRSIERAIAVLSRHNQVSTISRYHLWQRLLGHKKSDARSSPVATRMLKQEREATVRRIALKHGPVSSRIAAALVDTPRERFVAEQFLWKSAQDESVPLLPGGRAVVSAMHAYAVNYRLLHLSEGDRLLELGGGTGYGAAVAAGVVGSSGSVTTVEIVGNLARAAGRATARHKNVQVLAGRRSARDLLKSGAFNKVLFSFALESPPLDLLDLLPVGGRLVAPVRLDERGQALLCWVKRGTGYYAIRLGRVRYVPDRSEECG